MRSIPIWRVSHDARKIGSISTLYILYISPKYAWNITIAVFEVLCVLVVDHNSNDKWAVYFGDDDAHSMRIRLTLFVDVLKSNRVTLLAR